MAIDDPAFERALKQLEMEELGKAPRLVRSIVKDAINPSKAIGALIEGNFLEAATEFRDIHDAMASDRSLYLLFCLNEDVKRLRSQVEQFSQTQNEYLNGEFIGLMLDADQKARTTRSESRIKRLAHILTSSVTITPIPSGDETEEMLRIATDLSDEDIVVLNAVRQMQFRYERERGRTMTDLPLASVPGLKPEVVLGVCGKLLSLGLIAEPEQRAVALGTGSYPRGGGYMLLPRGESFLRFIEGWDTAPQGRE